MHPKDAEGMANSVDPDQTAPKEQSDPGLDRLPRPVCPKTWDQYSNLNSHIIKFEQCGFYHRVMCPKDTDGMVV